jgi:hypothetical protein
MPKQSRLVLSIQKLFKFVQFSNGSPFVNIQIQDHSTTGRELSIRKPDLSGIGSFTVSDNIDPWTVATT